MICLHGGYIFSVKLHALKTAWQKGHFSLNKLPKKLLENEKKNMSIPWNYS